MTPLNPLCRYTPGTIGGRSGWPEYAVKIISREKITELGYEANVIREIAVLRTLSHPGIARMVSCFRWRDGVYLVLEYASNGDLHSLIVDSGGAGGGGGGGGKDTTTRPRSRTTLLPLSHVPYPPPLSPTPGSLDTTSVKFVVGEVIAAVCSVHDAGFVYADLKPEVRAGGGR